MRLVIDPILPKGYTRLEYLESTGTQYLDTGYTLTSGKTMTFSGDIMWTDKNSTANFFYGYRSVNSATLVGDMRAFFIYGSTATPIGRVAIRYGVNADNSSSQAVYLNTKCNISWDGVNLNVDGTTVANLSSAYTECVYRSMYLFWANADGYYSADMGKYIGRIYNWKIYDDGVLVCSLIPALNPAGVPGMYDSVTGTFHTNIGTGDFVYKLLETEDQDDIIDSPKYQQLDYLESTGTQYIDTGFILTNDSSAELKITTGTSLGAMGIFGSRSGSSSNNFSMQIGNQADLICDFNNGDYDVYRYWITSSQNKSYILYASKEKRMINGTANITVCSDTITTPATAYLCGVSGSPLTTNKFIGKIHYCKIWNNKTLVKNFIPAIRKSDNAIGMYEKVSGEFFTSAGTGEFVAGDRVNQQLPKAYEKVAYLESSGAQYIDTGYSFNSNTDEITIVYQNESTAQHKWLFGSYESGKNIGISSGTLTAPTIWYKGNVSLTQEDEYYKAHTLKYDSTGMSNDYVNKSAFKDIQGTWNIYLFALNNTGTSPNSYFGYGRIYSYKQKRNNVLICDFQPVIRKLDNKPGMYDYVTGQFFVNQGTGADFTYASFDKEVKNITRFPYTKSEKDIIVDDLYKRVSYIESTDSQYIDTGYAFQDDFSWEIDFEGIERGKTIFGGRTPNTRTALLYQKTAGQGTATTCPIDGMTGDQTPFQLDDLSSGRHVVKMSVSSNKGSVWVDKIQVYDQTSFSGTYISGVTQALFADKFGDEDFREQSISKVYQLKMWQGNNLVRNFIPVVRISDNKPGMYDLVNKVFYMNANTSSVTDFNIGTTLKQTTYIESTATQYIDTGVVGKTGVEASVDFMWMNGNIGNDKYIIGSSAPSMRLYFGTYQGKWMFGNGGYLQAEGIQEFVPYHAYISWKLNDSYVDINGERILTSVESGAKDSELNIWLFSRNQGYYQQAWSSKIRLYTCKISQDGVLIRDFIPCLENGVCCLYDKVEGKVYYNKNESAFLYNTSEYTQRIVSGDKLAGIYKLLNYIESTGTQWIDTEYIPTENTRTIAKLYTTETGNKNWFGGKAVKGQDGNYTFNAMSRTNVEYIFGNSIWTSIPVMNEAIVGSPFEVDFGKNGIIINGKNIGIPASTSFGTGDLTMTIFIRNGGTAYINGRCYYLQMIENNRFIRSFVPVLRLTDNKPGLYDLIEKKFYVNKAETGDDFIYG